MQNYNDLKSNEAQFLSVVGVKLQQFNILVQFIEPYWETYIYSFADKKTTKYFWPAAVQVRKLRLKLNLPPCK